MVWDTIGRRKIPQKTHTLHADPYHCLLNQYMYIYSSLVELTIITQEANAPKVGVEICCLRQDRITGRRQVRFIGRWRHVIQTPES